MGSGNGFLIRRLIVAFRTSNYWRCLDLNVKEALESGCRIF
jgi:hypothetical protein